MTEDHFFRLGVVVTVTLMALLLLLLTQSG